MTDSTHLDHLAHSRRADARGSSRYDRAFARKIDTDGLGRAIECPAPSLLADYVLEVLAEGRTLLRRGALIVDSTGEPIASTDALLARIHGLLEALPERPDAAEPYRDIRLLMATGSTYRAVYVRQVYDAARASLPAYRAPRRAREERAPARTSTERARATRARHRAAEVGSARSWLLMLLDDEESAARPGNRLDAASLYASAASSIEEYEGDLLDDADEDGPRWRVPGKRTFYAVADHVLGARTRTARARLYIIPAEPNRDPFVVPADPTTREDPAS
ncbi:hypothetical protein [Agromyces kandeliae]|uniref:Uncharacterized protein n=1 Tax=Agromyces kandeliae TaxID=2666141 RepID=A0A6L5QX56_9MICO|nr:hypothetical protein [Agromyces kandeliae]MRX42351.1 hypothetical protein [Agromyces kandeliae]